MSLPIATEESSNVLVCHGATLETLDKIADIFGITIEKLHQHYAHEIRTGPEDARRDFLEQLRKQALAPKESPIRRLARQVVMILKPFEPATQASARPERITH